MTWLEEQFSKGYEKAIDDVKALFGEAIVVDDVGGGLWRLKDAIDKNLTHD